MGRRDEIKQVLRSLDKNNPGCLDNLDDYEINNIEEIKAIRNIWRIVNFRVKRDNDTHFFADGSENNIGDNRLKSFIFKLVLDI